MNFQELFDKIKRTAIVTNYRPAEKEIEAGKSKFGGKPYLPKDFPFPVRWICRNMKKYQNILQGWIGMSMMRKRFYMVMKKQKREFPNYLGITISNVNG